MYSAFLRSLFPRKCPCCRGAIRPDMLICPECRDVFKHIQPPYCLKCGRHVEEEDEYCRECASKDHGYTAGIAVFEYDSRMKRSMSDFKFNGWRENGEYYVQEALKYHADDILRFGPYALIPVPIHKSKRAYRGYNQAEIIADGIGEALNISVVKDLLVRNKKTSAQKTLGQESRSANLKSAFSCNTDRYDEESIGRLFPRVMLIDDIYTTGATMEGCTRALMSAGVQQVGILSIAAGSGITS
ncbi:MAG: ComF family protein [Lachnospiraceae bacterium]|nr:ComF family protein [Lachnospiraceae bacterium]